MHTTTYNNVHIASNNARMNIKANARQTKNQLGYDFIYQIAQYTIGNQSFTTNFNNGQNPIKNEHDFTIYSGYYEKIGD